MIYTLSELILSFILLALLCTCSYDKAIFFTTSEGCFSLRGTERHFLLWRGRFPVTSDWLVEKQRVDRQLLLSWRKLILGFTSRKK